MKNSILITNTDNEVVKIYKEQKKLFLELVLFDDNISKCEIFCEKAGWYDLESALEEKEGMNIEQIEKEHGLNEVLINFFESNLFPNYFN